MQNKRNFSTHLVSEEYSELSKMAKDLGFSFADFGRRLLQDELRTKTYYNRVKELL